MTMGCFLWKATCRETCPCRLGRGQRKRAGKHLAGALLHSVISPLVSHKPLSLLKNPFPKRISKLEYAPSCSWDKGSQYTKKQIYIAKKDESTSKKKPKTASAGNGRRPHPRFLSSRLRFWPVAIRKASMLTRQRSRRRKRPMPCQSLA